MKHRVSVCLLMSILLAALPPAHAGTKEELEQLQNDILDLRKQMLGFEKSFGERLEGLKTLVEQLNDQIAESNILFGKFAAEIEKLANRPSADQAILQELQTLSSKMDETGTRISALAQQLSELKVQSKPLSQRMLQGGSISDEEVSQNAIYDQAFNDFVQGNFDLAIQGFIAYLSNFPLGEKAALAQYNIGEAYYNQNRMPQAIAAFTRVINDYPGDGKTPSALFKRGLARLAINENEAATGDFQDIVEKFPETPEAGLARSELEKLGVRIKAPSNASGRKRR
jgi:tol-pal system protein YbgF